MRIILVVLTLSLVAMQDPPAPKAARSVHLWWEAAAGAEFYNEVRVEHTVPGSFFMAAGWNTGYFGIQELANRDKIVLFSVWDPTRGDDAKAVPPEKRVEVLHGDPDARIGRFGGEGTGAQCKYPYAWTPGERCRLLVRAVVEDDKTAYSGWFYRNDTKAWKHLATFRVVTKGSPLKGYYSFLEDFRRDGKSVGQQRRARYGPGWVRTLKDDWVPLTKVRFTADATPLETIDAAVAEEGFVLATGGETKSGTKLNSTLSLPDARRTSPGDLPPR